MPISRANGLDILYEKAGSGPALVLIHAMPFDHHLWLYQVERFSAHFTTIAMDLRGWGASAKPRTPFTLADMGRDVMGILADEGIAGGAVVMGCSVGSKIALMLACDHPDFFDAAILIGGNSGLQPQFDAQDRGLSRRARRRHAAGLSSRAFALRGHPDMGRQRHRHLSPRRICGARRQTGPGEHRPRFRGRRQLRSHPETAGLCDTDADRQRRARQCAERRHAHRLADQAFDSTASFPVPGIAASSRIRPASIRSCAIFW